MRCRHAQGDTIHHLEQRRSGIPELPRTNSACAACRWSGASEPAQSYAQQPPLAKYLACPSMNAAMRALGSVGDDDVTSLTVCCRVLDVKSRCSAYGPKTADRLAPNVGRRDEARFDPR